MNNTMVKGPWAKLVVAQHFKRQPHKMVKHSQTIRRQQPSVFSHFMGLRLKG